MCCLLEDKLTCFKCALQVLGYFFYIQHGNSSYTIACIVLNVQIWGIRSLCVSIKKLLKNEANVRNVQVDQSETIETSVKEKNSGCKNSGDFSKINLEK